jgi:glucose/arabinose dehydrogenase
LLAFATPASAAVRLQKVGDFDAPVSVAAAPGDYSRIYVVERAGTVRVIRDGVTLPDPFADLRSAVDDTGERGLFSIAFAPDFQTSRLVYAYYMDPFGALHVDELRAASADRADPSYQRVTIQITHLAAQHNGGTIAFGPDGMIYIATGDGTNSANAQSSSSLLGKVLRIEPIPGGGHRVPAGNPFGNEVWSLGLRNPFRFTIDGGTGDLVIGDVGASATEEIDFAPASLSRGRGWNYGWPACEGSYAQGSQTTPCPESGYENPVIDHFQPEWRAIIAGVVVRDPSLPSLQGRLLYGDEAGGQLWSAILRRPKAVDDRPLPLTLPLVTGFGEDAAGCVYAASLEGGVYRFVETSTSVPCPKPPTPAASSDRTPPFLSVRVPRRQRVRRRRGAIAYARCSERCTVSMSGRLRIGKRTYRLRKARKPADTGRRITLRVRLTRRASRALRRALLRRRRARVRVALRARDSAGNASGLHTRRVRVRR